MIDLHTHTTASDRRCSPAELLTRLAAAGSVQGPRDGFAPGLSRGRPGCDARQGPTLHQVIAQIHGAGGVASLAHPGLLRRDEWIADLATSRLDAIEAYHTNHDEAL